MYTPAHRRDDQEWDVHRFRGPSEFPPCLHIHTVAHAERVNLNISDDVHARIQDHMIKNETCIEFEMCTHMIGNKIRRNNRVTY